MSDTWTLVVCPPGGLAAGGGWYIPPSSAVDPDNFGIEPGVIATFGFIAKYQKGSSSPTGNLEFQYHTTTGLNLKSTTIQKLLVGSSNAQFGGTATLNGESNHYFRVIAADKGEPGVGQDTFAIKIWLGDPDNGGTLIHSSRKTLDGGNIQIKTK